MSPARRTIGLFVIFWVALFLLYLPAAPAGWVSDTLGWLEAVRRQSFTDFIARKGFSVRSFYQLTQIVTWGCYQMFGSNRWAWHLLQLSLHALNATLLYALLRGILKDSRIDRAEEFAFYVAALFCLSPYVSEVIVWEAAYHFLQGMQLLLLQLWLLRRYLHIRRTGLAITAVILFGISTFSLELFFLTPLLGLLLCAYYYFGLMWERKNVKHALLRVVLPQCVILLLYLLAVRTVLGTATGRLGNNPLERPITYFLVKPQENIFHLFGGRFLPQGWRNIVYAACSSYVGAGIFYAALGTALVWSLLRFRKSQAKAKAMTLAFMWLLLALAFISPLWFPQRLLITGDRYLYVLLPPFYLLIALGIMQIVRQAILRRTTIAMLLIFFMSLTYRLNRIWQTSEALTTQLQQNLNSTAGKLTLLLNSPASLQGAPMIGAGPDGEAALMHNLLYAPPAVKDVVEVCAYQLMQPDDSVSFEFLDKQTVKVRLTQPGSFWQWGSDIAHSQSTDAWRIAIDNADCCYVLSLRNPAINYRLLFQQRGSWHELSFPND